MTRRTLLALGMAPVWSAVLRGQSWDPLAGRIAPDIELLTPGGDSVTLDMSARDTVLYVVAPRNPGCADNLANMTALWQARQADYRFVALSVRRGGLSSDPASRQLPFPVYAFRDHRDFALQPYGFGAFPALYVTDARTRTIRRAWGGVLRGRQLTEVEQFFRVRLPGPSGQD